MNTSNSTLSTDLISTEVSTILPASNNPLVDSTYTLTARSSSSPIPQAASPNSLASGMSELPDFDGDGNADVFWRNLQTGDNALWLMNGDLGLLEYGALIQNLSAQELWEHDFGDFNGDGKTDIFLRNNTTGQNVVWLIDGNISNLQNGTSIIGGAFLQSLGDGIENTFNWRHDLGDFNGDGKEDIFWRNEDTGENKIWIMNGTSIVEDKTIQQLGTSTASAQDWSYKLGDFNGDGKSDVFLRDYGSGKNYVWLMNGTSIIDGKELTQLGGTSDTGSPDNWDFSLADFNGDGKSDVFLRDYGSGKNYVWLMNGTSISDGKELSQLGGISDTDNPNDWNFGIGDFNGDGKSDIFWRDYSTGKNYTWLMNGTILVDGKELSQLGNTSDTGNPNDWDFAIADFNGDGISDMFWRNDSDSKNAVWKMNGGTIIGGEFLSELDNNWYQSALDRNN
ncbi:MAG: VCBS repeat-containing protein [Cyanobacteria bacterium P01_A01_bin.84]